jgi:hypothetical protein
MVALAATLSHRSRRAGSALVRGALCPSAINISASIMRPVACLDARLGSDDSGKHVSLQG